MAKRRVEISFIQLFDPVENETAAEALYYLQLKKSNQVLDAC